MARSASREQAPVLICDLLQKRRTLARDELSARWVAKALGQTTGFLYHHWGSFDAFLLEVSGVGWQRLVEAVTSAYEKQREPRVMVRAYVDFALTHPVLYWLLAERPLPVEIVRARLERGEALPSLPAFQKFLELIARLEPSLGIAHARAMHAAAHGLASQLLSGRLMSTPDVAQKDPHEVAYAVADAIAEVAFTRPSRRT